jgi:hypothetical protein
MHQIRNNKEATVAEHSDRGIKYRQGCTTQQRARGDAGAEAPRQQSSQGLLFWHGAEGRRAERADQTKAKDEVPNDRHPGISSNNHSRGWDEG